MGRTKGRKRKSGAGPDEEIDSLFGLPPEDFVAARDELAGRLRQEGDAEAASEVKALRRPTVAAWAVNQLSRRHPEEVRELLDVGTELRRAHSRAVSKRGAGGLRESATRRRAIVARLADAADEILAEAGRGAGAHREAVVQSLEAATIDQEVVDLVARGRLSKEMTAVAGFGGMEGLAETEMTSKDERRGAPRRRGRLASDREEARRQELEVAHREAEELVESAVAGEEEAEGARREAEEAREEADRLERDWRAARDRAASAAASARTASTAADRARAAADRARRRLERLEAEISGADRP